jgi:hypothetical protein
MGVQIQCAECHNDPFKQWKQADFWGIAAFFRNMSGNAGFEAGNISIKETVSNEAQVAIPKEAFKNAGKIIPAKFMDNSAFKPQADELLRSAFADWLTARTNPYFARAFVNRTWAYFLGRGIVQPVDDFRNDNPPSHPALLQQLTEEFVASNFDIRHLIRCLTNSRAYQRTSQPAREKSAETLAAFGHMPVKVMSADMLYDSLSLAFNEDALDLRLYDAREVSGLGMSTPVGTAYDEFVKLFATNKEDATDFTHGIPQMLALLNHPRLRSGGKAVDALLKAKVGPEKAVETLYLSTLSRRPTTDELKEAQAFIAKCKDQRRAYKGVLWMLVNRSDFLLVH